MTLIGVQLAEPSVASQLLGLLAVAAICLITGKVIKEMDP